MPAAEPVAHETDARALLARGRDDGAFRERVIVADDAVAAAARRRAFLGI